MPPPRAARLWQTLEPAVAGRVVADCYGDEAGAEVLLRAFLAERDRQPEAVRFWLRVHAVLAEARSAPAPARRAPPSGAA